MTDALQSALKNEKDVLARLESKCEGITEENEDLKRRLKDTEVSDFLISMWNYSLMSQ
jgi:hypothetical protein